MSRPVRLHPRRWRPGFGGHREALLLALIAWLALSTVLGVGTARRIDWSQGAWWKGPLLTVGSMVVGAVAILVVPAVLVGIGFVADVIARRRSR